jgi:hypothetical protein
MNEDMVVLPTVFGSLCWILWIVLNAIVRLRTSSLQVALQTRLLEMLALRPDISEYMKCDAGQQLLRSLVVAPDAPHTRIVNAAQAGVVFVFVGASLLVARLFLSGETAPLIVGGVMLVGAGIGFAAAAMSAYSISRRLGLFTSGNANR